MDYSNLSLTKALQGWRTEIIHQVNSPFLVLHDRTKKVSPVYTQLLKDRRKILNPDECATPFLFVSLLGLMGKLERSLRAPNKTVSSHLKLV